MVTRCTSSHLMTSLLTWRNPNGQEEGWLYRGHSVSNIGWHVGKVISTEAGLALLTTLSAVETVAYGVFALGSLALYPVDGRPLIFFASLLESSSFTIIWGLADFLFYNPFMVNVMTRESFARYWAQMLNPTSITLYRLKDRLYVAEWEVQYRGQGRITNSLLRPIAIDGAQLNRLIANGAQFIVQNVLQDASSSTLKKFKEVNVSIFLFILTKAVSIYVFGDKKEDSIPDFFQRVTKNGISKLRSDLKGKNEMIEKLKKLTADLDAFKSEPEQDVKTVFNELRKIGSKEQQGGLFATKCWQKAIEILSENERMSISS